MVQRVQKYKNFWAGIIGNMLDHYDTALYGLMAPFIAPNFFPDDDPIVSLIKTYGLAVIGLLTRPLGALFFGYMAMSRGPKLCLVICIIGTALMTGIIAILPSYNKIGELAPLLLIIVRALQGIFAAGENTVAGFFLLQTAEQSKYTRTSSFYYCSSMFGVVLASLATTLTSHTSEPTYYWRYAFAVGFVTAVSGIWLRAISDDIVQSKIKLNFSEVITTLKTHRTTLVRIVLVSSFNYLTYSTPFIFMNNFVPRLTDITLQQMLELNSFLLVLDTTLIPLFGFLAELFNRARFMAIISCLLAITIIPLFNLIPGADYITIIVIRLWIIIAGLAFLAPLQAWYYELFKGSERYLITGLGYNIGSELFGRTSPAICLWLWYNFQHPAAPACYIAVIALLATIALIPYSRKQLTNNTQ